MLPLLSIIVFLPLAGAVITALLPKDRPFAPRAVALGVMLVDLALATYALVTFDVNGGYQFAERFAWVPQAGIEYHLAVDGISMPLLALSALLTVLAILASWKIDKQPGFYFTMILLLAVGMNGVFCALDFVLFYVFWELVLVPMYFLIAIWGGPRREYAAIKFFLYTLFGSVFMLVGIIALYLTQGTFNIADLAVLASSADTALPYGVQFWIFAAFFLGFAVKVPVFPLHTWLPDAHVEAPTAGSVLLAGILLKMGTYGFVRISLPVLPDAAASEFWTWTLGILAAVSIVYGAAVAFAQTDLKKLVAYSSVSHMGFVMLGIASGTAEGIDGAVTVMVAHGLITGMMFLLVGMVYERTHTRMIAEVTGLSKQAPVAGGLIAFASFASLGLPGLAGFPGEFLTLLGAWKSDMWPGLVIISAVGVLLAAAYMLWMVQRVVLGETKGAVEGITDLTRMEIGILVPLIVLTVGIGVYWSLLLRYVSPAVRAMLAGMGA
jgi:NADH-quinone oxidoreductase subunit M